MTEPDYEALWRKRILPRIRSQAVRSLPSTTVFLGAQPGAGKTRGQELVKKLYGGRILPIVGDDFRQYHPDFDTLVENDPLAMPGITAKAAGIWTGMAVKYADDHGVSCVIEGTWRNAPTVLDEAGRAIELGRGTHAVLLAVPPALSRLGTLARFYDDLASMGVARWTPPAAHETTIANLEKNVPLIADSGLMDRLTVISRDGAVLYDGHDPQAFATAWSQEFHRDLTPQEARQALSETARLRTLAERHTPGSQEATHQLDLIERDARRSLAHAENRDTPGAQATPERTGRGARPGQEPAGDTTRQAGKPATRQTERRGHHR